MVTRWPNTATLIYALPPTTNTLGYPVAGTVASISIYCTVQPNNAGITVSADGVERKYQFDVLCPLIATTISNSAVLKLKFQGKEFPVLQRFTWQKHEELKVG